MKKLKPIKGHTMGCLQQLLPLDTDLAVGFGQVVLTCNGKLIWAGDEAFKKRSKKANWAERLAKAKPRSDWRLEFQAPLSDRTYQRQGAGKWVLIKQGMGFA